MQASEMINGVGDLSIGDFLHQRLCKEILMLVGLKSSVMQTYQYLLYVIFTDLR